MEILLWGSGDPSVAAVLGRLEQSLVDRFGRQDVQRQAAGSTPDVVVIALRSGDMSAPPPGLGAAIQRALDRAVPLFALPLDGGAMPSAERVAPSLRPLLDAPTVAPNELIQLLQIVAQPDRALHLPPARPPPPSAGGPTLVRRIRRNLGRRDQVLLKMAGSSTAAGLALLATLGWGPASLFLFVGAVSFLLSTPPDEA